MSVKAIAINCSLKKSSGEPSSTDAMIALLKEKFSNHDVEITETLRIAAEAAGLRFAVNPVTHQGLNREVVDRQMQVLDGSDGPVLAYCASGTRSSIVWSLGQVGRSETDEISAATAKAGYDLERLRPQLDALRESDAENDAD